jgi:hypothetical protein
MLALIKKGVTGVGEHTYTFHTDQGNVIYKEWVEGFSVTKFSLQDKHGNEIDNPKPLNQIQEFIDEMGVDKRDK